MILKMILKMIPKMILKMVLKIISKIVLKIIILKKILMIPRVIKWMLMKKKKILKCFRTSGLNFNYFKQGYFSYIISYIIYIYHIYRIYISYISQKRRTLINLRPPDYYIHAFMHLLKDYA